MSDEPGTVPVSHISGFDQSPLCVEDIEAAFAAPANTTNASADTKTIEVIDRNFFIKFYKKKRVICKLIQINAHYSIFGLMVFN